ncbi:hypothetical protein Tco_1330930, partial [Tanacetum coccineum]
LKIFKKRIPTITVQPSCNYNPITLKNANDHGYKTKIPCNYKLTETNEECLHCKGFNGRRNNVFAARLAAEGMLCNFLSDIEFRRLQARDLLCTGPISNASVEAVKCEISIEFCAVEG